MSKYRIALMPGDGIGADVMDAARLVLDALNLDAEYVPLDIGWQFWCTEGNPLPKRTIDVLKKCTCALFGAITSKHQDEAAKELSPALREKGVTYRSPIVTLRQMFDLYTNMRPCKSYPGNPLNYRDDIDLVIFRENTEGLYSGIEFHPLPDQVRQALRAFNPAVDRFNDIPADEIAVGLRVITKRGAQRIIRKAFEFAREFGYPSVTLVEKANVLRETSGLMVSVAREVACGFSEIELRETYIDAQMMWLVKNPNNYGIMVTSNMFGDILSDLSAQLVGGLGFAASGNIGDEFAIFEPTHGSAPKYAGQHKVNPIAMLLSCKLMLDWLGESDKAHSLEKSIAALISEGSIRTYDMGGNNSTIDVARAVAEKV
jgi:3-isopropylmalate dehydrogenase